MSAEPQKKKLMEELTLASNLDQKGTGKNKSLNELTNQGNILSLSPTLEPNLAILSYFVAPLLFENGELSSKT